MPTGALNATTTIATHSEYQSGPDAALHIATPRHHTLPVYEGRARWRVWGDRASSLGFSTRVLVAWRQIFPLLPNVLAWMERRERGGQGHLRIITFWREIADEVDHKRTPLEIQAVCALDGIGLLRTVLGNRLDVGGSMTDGRIDVVIRGPNEYALAGELAGMVEWPR